MRSYKFSILLGILLCFLAQITRANDTLTTVIDSVAVTTDSVDVSAVHNLDVVEKTEPYFSEKLLSDKGLPVVAILFAILGLLYYTFKSLSAGIRNMLDTDDNLMVVQRFDLEEKLSGYSATRNVLKIITPVMLLGYLLYVAVVGTGMQGYVMEWLNLLVRWAHVVAGVMWIGASFYFIFLENNLNRTKGIRSELAGNLWAVHGGGFYFLEKYKVAPKEIPEDLHWFKYEAYFTFLTGFTLMTVVYYMDAKAFLIDPSVADIPVWLGIMIGVATLALGWVVYDLMCRSPLIERQGWFAVFGCVLLTALAYFLTHVFNSRAAYIHFGALIGTIMVGNVYFNIIPAQKAMVRSATVGEALDASLGKKAGQRSLHNNYLTLPVIFIMISNHFPITFGHHYNWVILIVIGLASAGVKHYWNLVERGLVKTHILVLSVVTILSLALVTSPVFEETIDKAIPVSFVEANAIIQRRCVQCHSASPTDDQWTSAPNGVMYDTPEQIRNMSDKIMTRAVRSKTMPQGNKTKMTDEERLILKRWILQGAKIDD